MELKLPQIFLLLASYTPMSKHSANKVLQPTSYFRNFGARMNSRPS